MGQYERKRLDRHHTVGGDHGFGEDFRRDELGVLAAQIGF